jgi:hypothetical protein
MDILIMLYIVLNQISLDFGTLAPVFSSLISLIWNGSHLIKWVVH